LIYAAAAPGQSTGSIGIGDAIVLTADGSVLNLAADPGVTLAIGGPISGGGSVLVSGGTVEFTTANSYTGFTGVQNGTLQVDANGLIPNNLVFLAGNAAYVNELVSSNGTLVPTNYQDVIVASGASDTVTANAGGVLVFAGPAASLNFVGGVQESTVIGGSGKLIAVGGNGDLIFGGTSGADQLYTGDGNSTLVGGAGATITADGSGSVALVAGGGDVLFDASHDTGSVTLFGAAGDSTSILGGAGSVAAIVNNSDATVYGGSGNMTVFTGTGLLSLDYVVGFGGGNTYVDGFDVARDQIHLVGFANGTAQAVLAAETVTGGNTILVLPDATHIELFGVTNLTINNFT
jgi:autotransporter-associated beta strand protein